MNYIQKTPFMELYEEMSSLYDQDPVGVSGMNLNELDALLKLKLQDLAIINKKFPKIIPKSCTFCLPAISDFVTEQSKSVTPTCAARSVIGEKTVIWNYPGILPPVETVGSLDRQRREMNELLANTYIDTTGGWLCFGFIFRGHTGDTSTLIDNYAECIKYMVDTITKHSFGVATLENVRFTKNLTFDQKLLQNHLTLCIPYDQVATEKGLARYVSTEPIIDKLNFNIAAKKVTYDDIITDGSINADALSELFCQSGTISVEDPSICSIIAELLPKIGKGEPDAIKLQKIVNASTQERYLAKKLPGFTRNSKGLYNGTTENGTDFSGPADLGVEAKMYKSRDSAEYYSKKDSRSFHGADFVCVYLIYDKNHWGWLKKTPNGYDWANESDLPAALAGLIFEELQLCQCSGNSSGWKFETHSSQATAA